MDITITINCDNDAFGNGPDKGTEIARILEKLADKLKYQDPSEYAGIKLLDINGNSVGEFNAEE